ncbi:MAG: WecB/TagA/CpsF family glycosyltransferase [Microcystaceae cyanobacterium]
MNSRIIIKTRIDSTSYSDACDRIEDWVTQKISGYIVAANVHVVMMGYWQSAYQTILNNALLVTPDGMPLVIGLRLLGIKNQQRVYGPDLMLALCERAAQKQIPIFLYGGTSEMLTRLKTRLNQQFPQLNIAGAISPPFRSLTLEEEAQYRQEIIKSGAKVVFVGLGCPKQEQWMARQVPELPCVMLGVGAAFSFHSGMVSQAPRWMMKWGLEWLYRLVTEPRRLWKRYLINNPCFLVLFTLQWLKRKR